MLELEQRATDSIRAEVERRGWSLYECVEHLRLAGHVTHKATVQRFLRGSGRRLGLDEFAAWAVALSLPPLALLAPLTDWHRLTPQDRPEPMPKDDEAKRMAWERHNEQQQAEAAAVRGWFRGEAPLPDVPEPDRFVSAAREDRTDDEPELSAELRRQADRYSTATGDAKARITVELFAYLAKEQLAEFNEGQELARKRHKSTVRKSDDA